jgi:hypothetical protein
MNIVRLSALGLLLGAGLASAQDEPAIEALPQIVRVSYVQGDVRVARGKEGQKMSGAPWQKAEVNLPLESGFSLVTGSGRAEIEFEDASTIYLAENSVLEFEDLSATNGVPHTDLTLLSGTMSMDLRMMAKGELFAVHSPTDSFGARWPDKARLRVNSFLDGMTLTSPENLTVHTNWVVPVQMKAGVAATFHEGQRIFPEKPLDQGTYAEWDAWVAEREAAHNGAMSAAMNDAGLKEPLPGLPELAAAGRFFDCAPYGTCWEPTNGWVATLAAGHPAPRPAELTRQTVSVNALQTGGASGGSAAGRSVATTQPTQLVDEFDFPCTPWQVLNFMDRDPVTGKLRVVSSQLSPAGYWGLYPYRWTACHSGSWIRREHRYVWVVGRQRHHHCPVHWVKAGKAVGFVPVHPRDVAGRAPVNLKEGIYRATDRKGSAVERLAYSEGAPVKLLVEAPKEFRREYVAPLGRVEAPRVEARALAPSHDAQRSAAITFDRKTQGFTVARQVQASNGATRVVSQPIAGRGESYAAARGAGASYSGGGGATASRGSSYSGGGSSSSSAASHVSAPSAPAASASSAAAASSGKH